jgi:hypothetical protein
VQVRPEARTLDAAQRERAVALFDEIADVGFERIPPAPRPALVRGALRSSAL